MYLVYKLQKKTTKYIVQIDSPCGQKTRKSINEHVQIRSSKNYPVYNLPETNVIGMCFPKCFRFLTSYKVYEPIGIRDTF